MERNELPEACVANILCFTSPADAFSSSSVSSAFRSAADSDYVWERFLPSDYRHIIFSSIDNLYFSSKKQIYQRLCEPIFINNGQKMFKIEKSTGKKSWMLSAKELSIKWSDQQTRWAWNHMSESRFSEVAELITTDRLEIRGRIRTQILSPNTKYEAYLVVKTTSRAFGLDLIPSEISIKVGNKEVIKSMAYLSRLESKKEQLKRLMYGNREEMMRFMAVEGDVKEPKEREDGWLQIQLGEFESGEADEEVVMDIMEVKGYQLKGGLLVEGIEVTPKS